MNDPIIRGGVILEPRRDKTAFKPKVVETIHEYENPNFQDEMYLAGLPPRVYEDIDETYLPPHIAENLKLARELGVMGPKAALGYQETVRRLDSDGAQVLNTVTETIMLPDFTLPMDYANGGRQLKYILWGRVSTVVTTPGTIIFSLRWGGVAGVVVILSKAQRPKVTVSTNMAAQVEMLMHVRRSGAAGVAIGMGTCVMGNSIGDAAAVGEAVWPDAPAEVTIDTSTAKALSPTVKFSVATATTAWTTHMARIEAVT